MQDKLKKIVEKSLNRLQKKGILPKSLEAKVLITRPKDKTFGDFSTNLAMILSSKLKQKPSDIAAKLIENIVDEENLCSKVEIAGAGFINFYVNKEKLFEVLRTVAAQKQEFGLSKIKKAGKVQVEFVSANPVGPLHLGHGRWAAVGDVVANLLIASGYTVEREFYINDYGNQMKIFGQSVAARYRETFGQEPDFPENGYKGAYITEIAQEIADNDGDKHLSLTKDEQGKFFADRAYMQVLDHLKVTLKRFGVEFDSWFSERSMHQDDEINKIIDELRKNGHVYKAEGATWLKTSALDDDKDRVLIKEDGLPTYFAADIAYHANKLKRGFSKVINIWGADHHGYVARMKAAVKALGASDDFLEIIIGQLVNLTRSGKPVRMSKRTGEMVSFEELIDEVGVDAARYFFLSRSTDTPLEFDIDLAKKHSSENPVFYVQYAHARICSILRTAKERGVDLETGKEVNYEMLEHESELDLISMISRFPEVIERASNDRTPQRLTGYSHRLAEAFHVFYTNCRVIAEEEDLRLARASLLLCTQITLRNCLKLMGISAPEKM